MQFYLTLCNYKKTFIFLPFSFYYLSSECRRHGLDGGTCIARGTYLLTDFLTDVYKGSRTKESLTDPSWWSQDLWGTFYGVCHTLHRTEHMSMDYFRDQIFFFLKHRFQIFYEGSKSPSQIL